MHWTKDELLKTVTVKGFGIIIHTLGDATAGEVVENREQTRKKKGIMTRLCICSVRSWPIPCKRRDLI